MLVADEWCPYNCEPHSESLGFIVDIANEAFSKAGINIEYQTKPWARAIVDVREGRDHGLIGAGTSEVPDFVFPEIEQGLASHTFFTKEGSSWRYQGLESLKAVRLGVIKDYSYGNLFDDYIHPNKGSDNIVVQSGDGALRRNLQMLKLGRIDVLIEDSSVFQHHLFTSKDSQSYRKAGVAFSERVFIAFTPNNPNSPRYAKMLADAMREMRVSGRLNEILLRYGMADWVSAEVGE